MSVAIDNPQGTSEVLLVCEHASNWIPSEWQDLGLEQTVLTSHVAWDPGALGVATALSKQLNAVLIYGTISRLVYDCNRPPESPTAMPTQSEIYPIPGNTDLSASQRERRIEQVYRPFQHALMAELDRRQYPIVLVTIHSFTPIFMVKPERLKLAFLTLSTPDWPTY